MSRLNGQRWFLTYAQVNDELFDADILADALFLLSPEWLEVAHEQHQDGGSHYHVVIVFASRRQKPMSWFDVLGHHPNIKSIKNGGRDLFYRRHYIRKGEKGTHDTSHKDEPCDYDAITYFRGTPPPYSSTDAAERLSYGDILDTANSAKHFLQLVRQHRPSDFVLKNDAIEGFAVKYFANPQEYTPLYPADSYIVPAPVDAWVAEVFGEVCFFLIPARSPVPPFMY